MPFQTEQSEEFSLTKLIRELFIPENHQMIVHGDMTLEGDLLLDGDLIMEL